MAPVVDYGLTVSVHKYLLLHHLEKKSEFSFRHWRAGFTKAISPAKRGCFDGRTPSRNDTNYRDGITMKTYTRWLSSIAAMVCLFLLATCQGNKQASLTPTPTLSVASHAGKFPANPATSPHPGAETGACPNHPDSLSTGHEPGQDCGGVVVCRRDEPAGGGGAQLG